MFRLLQGLQYVAWLEGHQDWIRDLSFCQEEASGDVLLVSASSDYFIRLWRIARKEVVAGVPGSFEDSENRQKLVFVARDDGGNVPMFSVSLDALFVGHSHFVHSVGWSADGTRVVSASMDKTMIVWEKDPEEQVWIDRFRVGGLLCCCFKRKMRISKKNSESIYFCFCKKLVEILLGFLERRFLLTASLSSDTRLTDRFICGR